MCIVLYIVNESIHDVMCCGFESGWTRFEAVKHNNSILASELYRQDSDAHARMYKTACKL